ncbi:Crp/Fnr family transcriptional regulator [Marinivivus vitaminiproducens]|uniref:Crp/Fnr family transcriptional regulator n=1 Tax=Marinivivus vitaminiproducens TaxID=3035935 RepID=UPI0027A18CE5|nr:Crp/Fnr family transcriptional regulator [Geminicoccaceae bacterium SCSIO 64248]
MSHDRLSSARQALADSDLFKVLTPAQSERLLARGIAATYPARRLIFQKNDAGDSLLVVLSGRIKISNFAMDGRERVLNFMSAGDILGEIAVLDGGARTANATALEATDVLVLRRRDLLPLLREQPDIAIRLIEVLCAKLRVTTELMEDNQFLSMEMRLAKALIRLAGQRQNQALREFALKITQRELGGYAGLARENVNRQLGIWRELGFIRVEPGQIVLLDKAALQAIAEEAP